MAFMYLKDFWFALSYIVYNIEQNRINSLTDVSKPVVLGFVFFSAGWTVSGLVASNSAFGRLQYKCFWKPPIVYWDGR